ncbi:uncharacterized protein ARMOST_00137 [Armillaria ostoyae]|uniref:Uncharacterized protein n=1 Tax=Armillaria ostoyae TaxID=47428 RepID=A0A284QK92_ARMOS|nr:uncharacterized protein ARMOST_00137 [Armillaria ostoyae]
MGQAGLIFVRVSHCVDEKCRPMKSKMPSEVAPLRYLKRHTSILVPDALVYDSDSDNGVSGPWMIMDALDGGAAVSVWDSLTREQKHEFTLAMGDMYSSILSLRFNLRRKLAKHPIPRLARINAFHFTVPLTG